MDILVFLILMFLFFYFVSWEAILIVIAYFVILFICMGILDWKKKLNGASAILTFVIVTGITVGGLYGYYEYRKWKLIQELSGKEVFLWKVKDREYKQEPYSIEYSSESSSEETETNAGYSSSYDTSDFYDDGYEAGYEDGIHRDHGANKLSDEYEYEDGYSQGYYDAVHEDEDWEDDEEEDW